MPRLISTRQSDVKYAATPAPTKESSAGSQRSIASEGARARIARFCTMVSLLLCAMLATSCTSDIAGNGRVPTSISILPAGATIDAIGATQDFEVVITDQNGVVMEGQTIEWSALPVSVASVSTQGIATAQANGNSQIVAKSGGLQTSAALSVQQRANSLSKVSGDNQQGQVASQLPTQLRVVARDRMNNVVPGATVLFEVSSDGGSVTAASVIADATGGASTQWTLPTQASASHTVTARVNGAASATTQFAANAVAGPSATLEKASGDAQNGTVGINVSTVPTVRISDAFGNPVSGAAVLFQITGGGGAVTGAMTNTNSFGLASPTGWQLGSVPGPNSLRATAALVAPVDFIATAIIGPPSQVLPHQGNSQSAAIGTAVAVDPGVRVSDAFGNGIEAFAVSFAVRGGGGSITGGSVLTDANGVAIVGSWTVGLTPGANQLTATAGSLTPVVLTATGTVTPANAVVHAGDNQSATVGSNVSVPPAIRVTTAQGHPAPGVLVAFTVASGGGSTGSSPVVTDANGVATASSWTLGTATGANTLSASVVGLSLVNFSATGTAGPAANMQIVAGNSQSAGVGTAVAIDPAVRVTDAFGNSVSGASVSFVITVGAGAVAGSPAVTNAGGIATVASWTLGALQGLNQLRADLSGVSSVTFSATGTVQPAAMVIHLGNNQSATVGTQVVVAPAVRVTDAGSAPVQGVSVNFTVTGGGGTVAGGSATTDVNGVATVTSWTLGTIAGANALQASVASLPSVNFSATGTAGVATSIVVQAGDNQTALAGTQVAVAPSVKVRDVFANPVSLVTVTYAVTGGGGSITGAAPQTSVLGIAAVGSWTLGAGANTLSATATGGGIAGNPISFNATGSISSFNIELRFLTGTTPAQTLAFNNAVARWQSIITGDIPPFALNVGAGDCGSNSPAVNETIDDLVIFVTLEPIDGAGMVLGSAGPCRIRPGGGGPTALLPITGRMRFDTADLASMEASGILENVILHEMGHVLGIGTLWPAPFKALLALPSLPSSPGVDTHFTGLSAIAAFNTVGGAGYAFNKVPVENTAGGAGTRDAHWRESLFASELMTGFIGAGSSPLSVVTIKSLEDLGYTVSTATADTYILPGGGAMDTSPKIHLMGDVITTPPRIGGG